MKAAPRTAAVIDIGSAAIRMAIAQIDGRGAIKLMESLKRPVHLGKDTFTRGLIARNTVEECVEILQGFEQVLKEYGISDPAQVRAVATSAVREASNRQAVLDRIYSATGVLVEAVDEAVVSRLNYLSVQRLLRGHKSSARHTLTVDIGAGSTNLLVLQKNNVVYSHTHRLGSLRVLELLESYREPASHLQEILDNQVLELLELMNHSVRLSGSIRLLALNEASAFAARRILKKPDAALPADVPVIKVEKLARDLLSLSVDERAKKYHLSFAQAETFGPTLLAYVLLARRCKAETLTAAETSLQDGLLLETATEGVWTETFKRQIVRSALALGQKYDFNQVQAVHIAKLSQKLFRALREPFRIDPRYELILYIAALLHQIGTFINNQAHHKHAMYLIRNSNLFGLGEEDLNLVALTARYHRRAAPKLIHPEYQALDRDDRIAVSRMASILRIAVALESANRQRIRNFTCRIEENRFVITVKGADDLTLELLGLKQRGDFFQDVFGLSVELRKS
jgi:exopolyphosphatase/guanosine-5'-triphosphate,3'-diphosphate pyrophosphatase